jgi:hypothetical protein
MPFRRGNLDTFLDPEAKAARMGQNVGWPGDWGRAPGGVPEVQWPMP